MHHTILFFLTLWSAFLVIITHGLLVTFPAQPVAGQDNIYVWSRNGTDPVDFFLQTAKVNDSDHRDESRISRSSPVVVPNVSEGGGQGLIRFNIAGIFQIIAVDTQDRNPENAFFYTFVTVQDSNSVPSGMPQDNNGSNSEDGGNRSDGGNHNQTMTSGNSKPPAGRSSWHRAIAGGVVGGCVFLALIAGGALLVFRRRRDVKRDMETSGKHFLSISNLLRTRLNSIDVPHSPPTVPRITLVYCFLRLHCSSHFSNIEQLHTSFKRSTPFHISSLFSVLCKAVISTKKLRIILRHPEHDARTCFQHNKQTSFPFYSRYLPIAQDMLCASPSLSSECIVPDAISSPPRLLETANSNPSALQDGVLAMSVPQPTGDFDVATPTLQTSSGDLSPIRWDDHGNTLCRSCHNTLSHSWSTSLSPGSESIE
ncbi:hypothetical protein D9758_017170 [Tetrapyrgos nigripes]|uniref:GATA-type domain-containing protein n=1 Tax=Tetrapyrgos nigripes TaxID=182062 RepID=A0A8H5C8X9_9AGAR|nr:hypothetical protein D9758_017170 [Tetrapyrgos nigripes]